MCTPASFVLTKDAIFWSKKSDSHEDIIVENNLHADGVNGPNILRVEITPENADYRIPLKEWTYRVDQDIVPEWYDKKASEKLVRKELKAWLAEKIILPGVKVDKIEGDRYILALYGEIGVMRDSSQVGVMQNSSQVGVMRNSSQVGVMWGSSQVKGMCGSSQVQVMRGSSQVQEMWDSSQVQEMRGSSQVQEMWDSSQVQEMWDSSQVQEMRDRSIVRIFSKEAKVEKINGVYAVKLDYTGDVAEFERGK